MTAKRFFCLLLSLCMLFCAVSLGESGVSRSDPDPRGGVRMYSHNGHVTLIDGALAENPITGAEDAGVVISSVLDLLGEDERTELTYHRTLTDAGGTVDMDTAAVIVNDRTYAPVRYLAEFFGYRVNWDRETRTVILEEAG